MRRRRGHVEVVCRMEKWRTWLCFKRRVLFPGKCILVKLASHFRLKNKGKRQGLVNLCKDMETCGEYEDIQVMWEMLHSSHPPNHHNITTRKRVASYWAFCFRPTSKSCLHDNTL